MEQATRKPQRSILRLWRIVLTAAACVPAFLASLIFSPPTPGWLIANGVWILLFLFFYIVYLPLRYRKLAFKLSSEAVTVYSGVFYTRVRILPIANIQFTTLWDSPLHRMFGLCSLFIAAAGARVAVAGLTRQEAQALAELLPHEWHS